MKLVSIHLYICVTNMLFSFITTQLQTASKIFGGQMKTHFLAFFPGDDEKILGDLRDVAKDFKGQVCVFDVRILF